VLIEHESSVLAVFQSLVATIGELLPEFGRRLAVDSKAIRSRAKKGSEKVRRDGKADGRGEHDAAVAHKSKFVEREDGTYEQELYEWFGFKLHLMVDADHQLPVAFDVTKGLEGDSPYLEPLCKGFKTTHETLAKRTEEISADKAYDSRDNVLAAANLGAELLWQREEKGRSDSLHKAP
jgi:hypothetical protein